MKKLIFTIFLSMFLFACTSSKTLPTGNEPILKSVTIDSFMNNGLSKSIPIEFKIPANYIHADIKAPLTYSLWMPADQVENAKKTQDLPTSTGWMYGKASLDVGYDRFTDKFIGAENIVEQSKAAGFINVYSNRKTINGFPILFMEMEEASTGKQLYAMYIGMLVETNAIYIAYRPPVNNKEVGEYVWSNLKSSMRGI